MKNKLMWDCIKLYINAPEMRKQAQYTSTQDRLAALGKIIDEREKKEGYQRNPKGEYWAGSNRIPGDDMVNIVADKAESHLKNEKKLSRNGNVQKWSGLVAGIGAPAGSVGFAVPEIMQTFKPPAGVPRGRIALRGGGKLGIGALLSGLGWWLYSKSKETKQQANKAFNDASRTLGGAYELNGRVEKGDLK